MKLGKSNRDKQAVKVASVAVFNSDGLLLFGRRNDNNKWTLPGGHFEDNGETPLEAARRELKEETGLEGLEFEYLGRGLAGRNDDIVVYSFRCVVEGSPDGTGDPDEECSEWRWVEPSSIPQEVSENLHSPKNITLRLLDLQEGDVEEPMSKADPHFVEQNPYNGTAIRIPKFKTPSRRKWDADFLQRIAGGFAGGDVSRLRPVQIPTDQNLGSNMAVNKSRLTLYRRMLRAKDRLPPLVVRRNGNGWDLLDGNHRLEAARRSGVPLLHAVEVVSPPLKKGLSGLALVGALATGGAMKAPESTQQPEFHQIAQQQGVPAWNPEGLIPDMYPIAHLESSWGQNQAHLANKKGDFHTAHGALGFKPVTGHEEYLKSKSMRANYPGLEAPESFLQTFRTDPKFYNLLASAHFTRLKNRHGGPQQAAFAWRYGTGACANASKDQIDNDLYVQKYTHMNLNQKQPSKHEGLKKTSIPLSNVFLLNRWGHPITPARVDYHLQPGANTPPIKVQLGPDDIGEYSHVEDPQIEQDGEVQSFDYSKKLNPLHPKYFVSDGHHRVRAAQNRGDTHIEAEIHIPEPPHWLKGEKKALYEGQVRAEAAKLGKTEPDPLEPLLAHDDPRERIMALKSKFVTPYHLRMAMRDEDPDVRAAAVLHPKMTSALIKEVLRDPDLFIRQTVLQRPDLQDHHLEQALWDPELQAQAALHPALTQEQKQRLLNSNELPENVKSRVLAKTIGFVTYPKLGQPSPQTAPMVRDREAHDSRGGKGSLGYIKSNAQRSPLPGPQRTMSASMANSKVHSAITMPAYKVRANRGIPQGGGPFIGTLGHESQHSVYSALKQKYGRDAGHRIVAQTLSALTPKEHKVLAAITDWKIQNRYDPIHMPEERIAYLHNYLQDREFRQSAHKHMRIHKDEAACRSAQTAAKLIFRKLQERAQSLGPEHIGSVGIQKDEEAINSWVLRQSEQDLEYNVSHDMLGLKHKADEYLEAAKFLGQTDPDSAVFRRALLEDADPVVAALASVGLPADAEGRRAFAAVLELFQNQKLNKAEKPREVLALMVDGAAVADAVRRGFEQGGGQELHLGGKHSAGTLMVQDPDSDQTFLLKPGSGNQSPAAGAREEHASQSRREAAFWHIAEAWGLGRRIPRADLLLIDGQEVAAIHMLPFDWKNLERLKNKDPGLPHKALEKYRQTGELHRWAIMDAVLGNPDRHGQNLMIGPQKDGYPVALIDHGSAFAGNDFDPAHDKNSFIPYYLRAWKAEGWVELTYDQKLRSMPTVSGDTEKQLREWFHEVSSYELEAVLFRYGIDPAPSLARLAKMKGLLAESNFSEAINAFWLAL